MGIHKVKNKIIKGKAIKAINQSRGKIIKPIKNNINPSYYTLTKYRRKLLFRKTLAEKKLEKELIYKRIKFKCQKIIYPYIVDFFIADKKLIIEIDGKIHESDKAVIYDNKRTYKLEGYGFKVLRFSNKEIEDNINKVVKEIKRFKSSYDNYRYSNFIIDKLDCFLFDDIKLVTRKV